MKTRHNSALAASILFSTLLYSSSVLAGSQTGIASVYANGDGHAWSKTANGERVNPNALTAAHKTLPFGTLVSVTNKRNGRSVTVRINDRGQREHTDEKWPRRTLASLGGSAAGRGTSAIMLQPSSVTGSPIYCATVRTPGAHWTAR